jgi:hypothetical protein
MMSLANICSLAKLAETLKKYQKLKSIRNRPGNRNWNWDYMTGLG